MLSLWLTALMTFRQRAALPIVLGGTLGSPARAPAHDRADEAAVRLEMCVSRWSQRHPEQAEALNARLREVSDR